PGLWKLGLLPWAVLLVWAVYSLWRRFCPGLEEPGAWLVVLSPALLPSFNLMLDVPALALGLAALEVFLRAADRCSHALAACAGLLAGLAVQTKYTALTMPAAMFLYWAVTSRWPRSAGGLRDAARRLLLWPAAALVAASVFV